MSSLTKADLLRGTDPVEVEIDGIGLVTIRALTDGEYQQCQNILLRGISAVTDVEKIKKIQAQGLAGLDIKFDIAALVHGEFEANVQAVVFGLSSGKDRYTPDEVRRISPPGAVGKIATEIYKLSGVGDGIDAMVASFRAQPRRDRDPGPA